MHVSIQLSSFLHYACIHARQSADRIAAAAAVAASGAFVGALNFFSPDGAFDDLESLAGGIATQAGIDSRALPCYAIVVSVVLIHDFLIHQQL